MKRISKEDLEDFRAKWFTDLQGKAKRKVRMNEPLLKSLANERHIESGLPFAICKQFVIEDIQRLGLVVG